LGPHSGSNPSDFSRILASAFDSLPEPVTSEK